MNYVKNNRNKVHTLIKASIIFTAVSPIIINSHSTKAMFKSSVKNPTSSKGTGIQSLINRFEGISGGTTSSTLTSPKNPRPKLLPKPLSVSGIKYPYGEPSSNVEPKISSGVQSPSTKPKVKFSPTVDIKFFNPNDEKTPSIKHKADLSTKPKTKPPLPPKPQFSLKITNSPNPKQKPINISEKRIKDLEVLIKGNVAAIVKQNLSEDFKPSGPITIKFDEKSGQELSVALSRFIYRTTKNTLSSLSQKQN